MDYSQELPVLFPLSYLHWETSVFVVLPSSFPLFDPSLESNIYPTYLYFFSLSPLCFSVTLFGPLHLADIVNSHSFSSPEVTPWPGYTIRSSLLANTQTRRQTKAVCFFVVLLASIILYLFLPRHFFFSLLSSHPLLQYIFSMVYNEPVCAKKN